jgi:hypothetical protein
MAKLCKRRKEVETVMLPESMDMECFLVHDENELAGVEPSQAEAEEFARICADQVNRPFYVTSCLATLTEHKPLVKVEPQLFADELSESYDEWHHTKTSKGSESDLAPTADDVPF